MTSLKTALLSSRSMLLLGLLMVSGSGCGGGTASSSNMTTTTPNTSNQWTWVGGSKTISTTDKPSGRLDAASWTDASGNLWLFGGSDNEALSHDMNDLWKYSVASNTWTQVSGSTTYNAVGVYGTKGVASATNVPGAREGSRGWIDSTGNLWLFGGYVNGTSGGYLNDLWSFNPTTKEWTWISGSNAPNATAVYGTLGITSATNVPGARYRPAASVDAAGNFWIFGGQGYDASYLRYLSDLWKFNPATGQWTWIGGSATSQVVGVYGTLGVASSGNLPGERQGAASWIDSSGNLWLFGGDGTDAAAHGGQFNDLWEFNPTTGLWVWISGSNTVNAPGVYGTLATPSSSNTPEGRAFSAAWTDKNSNFWLFGGTNDGVNQNGPDVVFNDLWRFSPAAKTWTWVSGGNTTNSSGNYGTQGVTSTSNVPSSRVDGASWIDPSGNFWLFGGGGYDSTGTLGVLSDLWRYQP